MFHVSSRSPVSHNALRVCRRWRITSTIASSVTKLVVFFHIVYGEVSLRWKEPWLIEPKESIDGGDVDFSCKMDQPFLSLTKTNVRQDLFTPTIYWPMIESSLGIVGACLPLLRPILSEIASFESLRSIFSPSVSTRGSSREGFNSAKALEAGVSKSSLQGSTVTSTR